VKGGRTDSTRFSIGFEFIFVAANYREVMILDRCTTGNLFFDNACNAIARAFGEFLRRHRSPAGRIDWSFVSRRDLNNDLRSSRAHLAIKFASGSIAWKERAGK